MAASVEITTTQNVTIEYELARARDRVGAFMLDLMIVGVGYFLFFIIIITIFDDNFINQWWEIFFSTLAIVAYALYYIVSEVVFTGQTLGKRALNCKVVRLDGKEPRWSDVVLRTMLQMVDIWACVGVIGLILIKTTPKGQRLGDMAANTAVIRIQSSFGRFTLGEILNIVSVTNYQPQYPQVRTLSEQDMILIKNTLSRYQKYPNPAHESAVNALCAKLEEVLAIPRVQHSGVDFLKTLLRDYIVLTR